MYSYKTLLMTAFMVLFSLQASAQWITQTITLNPGWNAVYLEVQPQIEECEHLFKDMPIQSIWAWNRKFSSVQFIQNMSTLVPSNQDWLTYFPQTSRKSFLTNLHKIQGGKAYLINVDSTTTITLPIEGTSCLPSYEWLSDSFNLVGFHVDSGTTTVKDFFSHSEAHDGQVIYQLDSSGQWHLKDENSFIQAGKAYWAFCKGNSTYHGTCYPVLEQGDGLHFGSILNEQLLRIKNDASVENTITIQLSETSVKNVRSTNSEIPLTYWKDSEQQWDNFPDSMYITIPPHSEAAIRLGLKRKITTKRSDTGIDGLLSISDTQGTHYIVPVSGENMSSSRSGLWIGTAVINQVSCPACEDKTTPFPTGSEFQMRLLVHVDENEQARLLQQVALLRIPETLKDDPENPGQKIVDQPGKYMLITDNNLLSEYIESTNQDSQIVGQRLSSAAFSFSNPILMTGAFNSVLRCSITIDENDPLNPFLHKPHPDHDNLGFDYKPFPSDSKRYTRESYTIGRNIRLTFSENPPEGETDNTWGTTMLGGEYRETIEGVHKEDIYIEGSFELKLISRISQLNDGE